MLTKVQVERHITSIRICRGVPLINHLLFADDDILFCKVDMIENMNILSLLQWYEHASGQQINRENTLMTFSNNVPADT